MRWRAGDSARSYLPRTIDLAQKSMLMNKWNVDTTHPGPIPDPENTEFARASHIFENVTGYVPQPCNLSSQAYRPVCRSDPCTFQSARERNQRRPPYVEYSLVLEHVAVLLSPLLMHMAILCVKYILYVPHEEALCLWTSDVPERGEIRMHHTANELEAIVHDDGNTKREDGNQYRADAEIHREGKSRAKMACAAFAIATYVGKWSCLWEASMICAESESGESPRQMGSTMDSSSALVPCQCLLMVLSRSVGTRNLWIS